MHCIEQTILKTMLTTVKVLNNNSHHNYYYVCCYFYCWECYNMRNRSKPDVDLIELTLAFQN